MSAGKNWPKSFTEPQGFDHKRFQNKVQVRQATAAERVRYGMKGGKSK